MNDSQKALEFKVGIFVLIGLVVIGGLTLYFGGIGEGFKKYYDLTVELPNAGGLLKSAEVQLAGARIGYVVDKPQISPGNIGSVAVKMKIYEQVKIPRDASFKVATAGLLGDVLVEVKLSPGFDLSKFDPKDPKQVLQPGETVPGKKTEGLDDLAKKGADTLDDLRASLAEMKTAVMSLNTKLLTDENAKNVKETLQHFNTATSSLVETSKKLDGVVQSAQGAVDSAKHTMATADAAAADFRATAGSVKETFESVNRLVKKISDGDGVLAMLIKDRELAKSLKALILNLKEHGLLFYHDTAQPQQQPEKAATRKR